MSLEEELAAELSKKIAQAIDDNLMGDMMVSCGWTRVKEQFYHSRQQAVDINDWLEQHCKGKYKRLNYGDLLFENSQDATMYILKWL